MPEYLAPGVYVEETSFRAKSIEGVSTSTTAFVGPTRRGPIGDTPELVTSFADFSRIYGGLGDVFGKPNYLAHAVRAYFNEGGSRLYVSRAFQAGLADDGIAVADKAVVTGGTAAESAAFVARVPGSAGNGRIILRQVATPVTRQTMDLAPAGSMLRTGGDDPALPARILAGPPPFLVKNATQLRLTVSGVNFDIDFKGQSAEVRGSGGLAANVDLTTADPLEVSINGGPFQAIALEARSYARDELVAEVNSQLLGGYAKLADTDKLAIGTERKGYGASVTVRANAEFGFAADHSHSTNQNASNTLPDLGNLTAGALDALLVAAGAGVRAAIDPQTGQVALATEETGTAATLAIRGGAGSAHGALGLAAGGDPVTGEDGTELAYYLKTGGAWSDSAGDQLVPGPLPEWEPVGGGDLLSIFVVAQDADGNENAFENLGFDRAHPRFVGDVLSLTPSRRSAQLEHMYALTVGASVDAFALREGLFGSADDAEFRFEGGDDGVQPTTAAYEAALRLLEPLEDISIIAAPGHSAYTEWEGIQRALITHVSRPRAYQIAVLDTPPQLSVGEARKVRSRIDSTKAALYFPWVTVANPLARPGIESIPREVDLPPSGFISGIYARNDAERGVHKAPANEVVRSALRFETDVNTAQQDVLNPLGVNCLRFFAGRGYRVWGARTVSSDPEWKYVNVRRYFNYLERSIDNGTQWAVFEPNGERLWANVRETVSAFLYNEWRSGALLGGSPKEAYFVRCDRSTMTQNDLDNGRLICLIGVAVIKPAEFVIFRIGQKTADARS